METITREEIIALINQYIYTNGNQLITAAQLKEILLDIANAFAMNGSAAGIDDVLEAGSSVSANRKITNEQGGAFNLAASTVLDGTNFPYIGLDATAPTSQTVDYFGIGRGIIGSFKRSGPTRNIFEVLASGELNDGEVLAGISFTTLGSGKDGPRNGVNIITGSQKGKNTISVQEERVNTMSANEEGEFCAFEVSPNFVSSSTYDGTGNGIYQNMGVDRVQMVINTVDTNTQLIKTTDVKGESWLIDQVNVAAIEAPGLTLAENKRLRLNTAGAAPTAGMATLSGGSATVATAAIEPNSMISLTVQQTGAFTGNIRVSSKTPGTGFTITSTQDTDSCLVFWQIIDLL